MVVAKPIWVYLWFVKWWGKADGGETSPGGFVLGVCLSELICPDAEPFGFVFCALGGVVAVTGHRACCRLLVLVRSVLLGRRPCGRLLPTASRRSNCACCRLLVLVRSVLLGRRPCGRLLPTASRRSNCACCRLVVLVRSVLLGRRLCRRLLPTASRRSQPCRVQIGDPLRVK